MKSTHIAVSALTAAGLVAAGVQSAAAEGLLGKRYANVMAGQLFTNDDHLEKYSDAFFAVEAKVNAPVSEHVDLAFRYGRETLEGDHGDESLDESEGVYLGSATYHFQPGNHHYNPYLRARAGLTRVKIEHTEPGHSDTTTHDEFTYAVAAGADFGLGKHAAIAPELSYHVVDDEGQFIGAVEANYWFNERFFGVAKGEYRGEHGDIGYFAGAGVHF